jgi:flagellar biogenesis protein FliO
LGLPLSEQVLGGQIAVSGWLELGLKLALVLLLVYLAAFLLQRGTLSGFFSRWQPHTSSSDTIKTLAIHPLTPGVSLYLVEVEKRRLLLSISAQTSAQLLLDLGLSSEEEAMLNP